MRWIVVFLVSIVHLACTTSTEVENKTHIEHIERGNDKLLFQSHEVSIKEGNLQMCWQGADGTLLQTFTRLKEELKQGNKELKFAMNGGMFLTDYSPQGLYVEKGKTIRKLNTKKNNYGNFYMAPNGVFYLTNNLEAVVCTAPSFMPSSDIDYATQSGPMLLIDSAIHPKFTQGSKNVHIRNGVGILPNGNPLFAISTEPVNLYDFADFFRKKGCANALYLDGFVSRIYLPAKGIEQIDGRFGVMIAEVK